MMDGNGWAMGLGGGLWMILEIAVGIAIVAALVWLVASAIQGRQSSTTDDAARILKARLARGEISPEEYEQARRLLGVS